MKYTGGHKAGKGTYWNFMTGQRVDLEQEGMLPGDEKARYIKASGAVVLLFGPVLGCHSGIPALHRHCHGGDAGRKEDRRSGRPGGKERVLRVAAGGGVPGRKAEEEGIERDKRDQEAAMNGKHFLSTRQNTGGPAYEVRPRGILARIFGSKRRTALCGRGNGCFFYSPLFLFLRDLSCCGERRRTGPFR